MFGEKPMQPLWGIASPEFIHRRVELVPMGRQEIIQASRRDREHLGRGGDQEKGSAGEGDRAQVFFGRELAGHRHARDGGHHRRADSDLDVEGAVRHGRPANTML